MDVRPTVVKGLAGLGDFIHEPAQGAVLQTVESVSLTSGMTAPSRSEQRRQEHERQQLLLHLAKQSIADNQARPLPLRPPPFFSPLPSAAHLPTPSSAQRCSLC